MKLKLPLSVYNWISIAGSMIAIISFFMIVFLFTVSTIMGQGKSYLGLVIYILLPSIMITGLLLIPVGMIFKIRKDKREKRKKIDKWPVFNLNNIRHRNAFFIFIIGTSFFLFISAIGSYEAFHFTDSVVFCGEICHRVMKPEYTAYQNSSHARVKCVECHVGSGASWYVRSKLSGLYQVYAVLANVYPQPIPTPIKDLRPARETCEQCHWPEKFYAYKFRVRKSFLSDEHNTEWDIKMNMKIGAEHAALGLTEGIHWHINPHITIRYYSEDNEYIPVVKISNRITGESAFYSHEDYEADINQIDSTEFHLMDCMDCHNRPSHNYNPPSIFMNQALAAGLIPVELPEIKMISTEICDREFPDEQSALKNIDSVLNDFYQENYPDVYKNKTEFINRAIQGLQTQYSKNIFPEMKVRWSAYPNQIGHLEYMGCFRCHDDQHHNAEGKGISKDCNLCHEIIAQGKPDSLMYSQSGNILEFQHPVNIEEAWKDGFCTDCHTGLSP
jgi:hypothetical protein